MAQGRVPQAWERFAVALLGKELCACVLVIAARATMIVLTAAARAVSRIPAILSAAADRGRRRWRRHRRYLVARTLVVVVAVALGATTSVLILHINLGGVDGAGGITLSLKIEFDAVDAKAVIFSVEDDSGTVFSLRRGGSGPSVRRCRTPSSQWRTGRSRRMTAGWCRR